MRYQMSCCAALLLFLALSAPPLSLAQAPAVPAAGAPGAKADSRLAEAASRHDTALGPHASLPETYVNAPDVQGRQALHWAVQLDDIDLTRLLLTCRRGRQSSRIAMA
jgi:hypothetical protein